MLREQRELEDHAEHDDQHHALAAQRSSSCTICYTRNGMNWRKVVTLKAYMSLHLQTPLPRQLRRIRRFIKSEGGYKRLRASWQAILTLRTAQVMDTIHSTLLPLEPLSCSLPEIPEPVDHLYLLSHSYSRMQSHICRTSLFLKRSSYSLHPRDLSTRCWNFSPANVLHASWPSNLPTIYVFTKKKAPHFWDVLASQLLKRNQEVEGRIWAIENIVKPPTSEAYI